jgi:ABC-type lipoprotein release transport system permease subunit
MEHAIIGLVSFIIGVALGLWCKVTIDKDEAFDSGYDHGFSDASMAMEFLEKRMEGK